MEKIPLPSPLPLTKTLADTLASRESRRNFKNVSLSLEQLASLLFYSAHANNHTRRPYPSGGGLYPIEIYVASFLVEKYEHSILHYEPDAHVLRRLWDIPKEVQPASLVQIDGGASPAAVIVLTAAWGRSANKYRDFAYILSTLEAGHLAQNILLCAEALYIDTCSLGAFNDNAIMSLLDLDTTEEQPVHVIAIGSS